MSNISYAGTLITSFRAATDFTQAGATWLVCDGRWLNTSAYPALSAALSGRYGASGTAQFALPDLRNYTIISSDTTTQRVLLGPGASGTGAGTIQPSSTVTHSHPFAFTPGSPDFSNSPPGFAGQCPTNSPGGSDSTGAAVLEPSGVSMGMYSAPSGVQVGSPGEDLQVAHFPIVTFVRAD